MTNLKNTINANITIDIKEAKPSKESLEALEELEYMEKHPEEYKAYKNITELKKDLLSDD